MTTSPSNLHLNLNKPNMQITKTNFQSVGELSQQLLREKVSRGRFSLEKPAREVANGIAAGMKAVVEYRGGEIILDDDTKSHILQAAEWLSNPTERNSLLLCGLYGNGKTTLAEAIQWLIGYVTEREKCYSQRLNVPMITAKNFCKLAVSAEKYPDDKLKLKNLTNAPVLILDELGREPGEVIIYGMPHTPVLDLLEDRYASRRTTIITTNLESQQIEEKYGPHIYDRFCEMMRSIIFENESYRRRK